eukprot:4367926-Prymnesium_polylepis.1
MQNRHCRFGHPDIARSSSAAQWLPVHRTCRMGLDLVSTAPPKPQGRPVRVTHIGPTFGRRSPLKRDHNAHWQAGGKHRASTVPTTGCESIATQTSAVFR